MDPIGNLLTIIRNATNARQNSVRVSYSNVKSNICQILKELEVIAGYKLEQNGNKKEIVIDIIRGRGSCHLKRISKPGRRIYVKSNEIRIPLSGIGNLVISTSSGLMEARKAKKLGLGGEVICEVW